MSLAVQALAVVIPARNEQELLGRCLDSVLRAAARVEAPVTTVVVLDRCTDATSRVLESRDLLVVHSLAGCVGAARAAGVQAALRRLSHIDTRRIWIASTDADSFVESSWLAHQVALAQGGADMMLGTVRLVGAPAQLDAAWTATYAAADGHRHVHGANLGVRANVYLQAGGFSAVPVHEDVELARAVAADPSAVIVRSAASPVRTSARRVGRAPGGFGAYLNGYWRHNTDYSERNTAVTRPNTVA